MACIVLQRLETAANTYFVLLNPAVPLLNPKIQTLNRKPLTPTQGNKEEQARLRQAGAQLAPLGFHLQGPAKPQEMGVGPLR